jgi:hypothetical protein
MGEKAEGEFIEQNQEAEEGESYEEFEVYRSIHKTCPVQRNC